MIALLTLLLGTTWAQPGRTTATGTIGLLADGQTLSARGTPSLSARGMIDHGLKRRFSLSAELGVLGTPSGATVDACLAPNLELFDTRWWRVSAVVAPALTIATDRQPPPGMPVIGDDIGVVLRSGIRVHWLAFWGVSIVARGDHIRALDGTGGWTEVALGAAIRM